jgi:hypothetical protein
MAKSIEYLTRCGTTRDDFVRRGVTKKRRTSNLMDPSVPSFRSPQFTCQLITRLYPFLAFICSRSNASTDSGLKSSPNPPTSCDLEDQTALEDEDPRHLFRKNNATVIACSHHKGMKCTQITLARHFSLSSLLEALPAASVDSEDVVVIDKHASMTSLSSGSRYSDFDGYFYI